MRTHMRPDLDTWAFGIAEAVALRGDCTRRRVGALLLDRDHNDIAFGYNGTWPGGPSCLQGDCPRGRHYRQADPVGHWCALDPDHGYQGPELTICTECRFEYLCSCGQPWPCAETVAPGSSYDTGPGVCIASHAEINCLTGVDARHRLDGATMYVTEEPCGGCAKILRNSTRIARIVWPSGQLDLDGIRSAAQHRSPRKDPDPVPLVA